MNRVLLGMASANYVLVILTMYLGFLSDPPGPPAGIPEFDLDPPAVQATGELGSGYFRYHFELGLLTALVTMLVHCLVFTYFLGTTRWVRETAAAYKLDPAFTRTSLRCRTRSMAMSFIGILLVVATVATGAGAHLRIWPGWLHQVTPLVTYTFMLYAYRVQYVSLETHIELTDTVMSEVNAIRKARGLPIE